jgi:hypothetical protein
MSSFLLGSAGGAASFPVRPPASLAGQARATLILVTNVPNIIKIGIFIPEFFPDDPMSDSLITPESGARRLGVKRDLHCRPPGFMRSLVPVTVDDPHARLGRAHAILDSAHLE